MDRVSLTIDNRSRYQEIADVARRNGSVKSLADCIVNFTADQCVILRPHPTDLEFFVEWYADETETQPLQVGRLIYDSSDNSWSVQT